jgi:hypothetical protein
MASSWKGILIFVAVLICWAYLPGAASSPSAVDLIRRGDRVMVDISCRTGRDLVWTTLESLAKDDATPKADIYMGLPPYAPNELIAGSGYGGPSEGILIALPSAVGAEVSRVLPGMAIGEARTLRVRAETNTQAPPEERYETYSRITWKPRTAEVPMDAFRSKLGREPIVGEVLQQTAASKTTVHDVRDDKVFIRTEIEEGALVSPGYGRAKARLVEGDRYELLLQVREGDVLRFGPLLARVAKVDEQTFTVDYANPLGGLELECEVRPVRAAGGTQ